MDDRVLYPPNRRELIDAVTSNVMQRFAETPSSRPQSVPFSVQKSQLRGVHVAVHSPREATSPLTYQVDAAAQIRIAANFSDEVAYCRARSREHQARHNMKQLKKMQDLETSIRQLR
ncbi:hypothetical protein PHYPSEUDO_003174 [Phytophthora pseudosyringae]|uniref:Uncharacterized protein n=1 Tax=Phytophthora pseudosyringae TaxID=221518 RepID=A0A8T1VRH5_9STRA|nr:hypothetical protein PHYPSEUDO_003174 [Phytophthora pseudosyringae]